jgi:hypothetical protein
LSRGNNQYASPVVNTSYIAHSKQKADVRSQVRSNSSMGSRNPSTTLAAKVLKGMTKDYSQQHNLFNSETKKELAKFGSTAKAEVEAKGKSLNQTMGSTDIESLVAKSGIFKTNKNFTDNLKHKIHSKSFN